MDSLVLIITDYYCLISIGGRLFNYYFFLIFFEGIIIYFIYVFIHKTKLSSRVIVGGPRGSYTNNLKLTIQTTRKFVVCDQFG